MESGFDWVKEALQEMVIEPEVKYIFNNVGDIDAIKGKFYQLWGQHFIDDIIKTHNYYYINLFNNEYIDSELKSGKQISICITWYYSHSKNRYLITTGWNDNYSYTNKPSYDVSEFLNANIIPIN
jgi:hypothetical protein